MCVCVCSVCLLLDISQIFRLFLKVGNCFCDFVQTHTYTASLGHTHAYMYIYIHVYVLANTQTHSLTHMITITHTHTHTNNCFFLGLTYDDDELTYMQEILPTEVLVQIFSYLRENDLINVSKVCRRFNQIGNLDSLWKNLFYRVYEMEEAYIVPEQSMSMSPDPRMNSSQSLGNYFTYKEQFSVMVRLREKAKKLKIK